MKTGLVLLVSASILSLGCSRLSSNLFVNNDLNPIVNGKSAEATDDVSASTVALVRVEGDLVSSSCTGTLISSNIVVTAAHCLAFLNMPLSEDDEGSTKIYIGSKIPSDAKSLELLEIADFKAHPKFPGFDADLMVLENRLFDVGVIRLKNKVSDQLRPMAILAPEAELKDGQELVLAGFGVTDELGMPSKTLQVTTVPLAKIIESLLITDQTKSGACAGDSGGPAYVRVGKDLVVAGATRGPHLPHMDCNHYGEFTHISKYKDFIIEAVSKLGGEAPRFINLK